MTGCRCVIFRVDSLEWIVIAGKSAESDRRVDQWDMRRVSSKDGLALVLPLIIIDVRTGVGQARSPNIMEDVCSHVNTRKTLVIRPSDGTAGRTSCFEG
jgi:hypothetical protein